MMLVTSVGSDWLMTPSYWLSPSGGDEVKPHLYCQCDLGMALACVPVVDSNRSSYEQWNCGETKPVWRLRISATDEACFGDGPKLIPILVLSIHFHAFLPSCIFLSSTYTGHPKWC